ncbi:MAG: Hsp20/alpha crystallin family protein [Deltaproteobacteria bacterium]|nr:Hsp20/alpha crystallin family protein [Deltaproteobacteria bacterium]
MANQEIQVVDKKEFSPESGEITRNGLYFTPAVDIFENSNELTVVVDMPGINSEDVEVDLRENILTIIGDAKAEEFGGQELLTEYRTGGYYRTFRVNNLIDHAKIAASMNDGVLTLKLPKSEKAIPRKIPVVCD